MTHVAPVKQEADHVPRRAKRPSLTAMILVGLGAGIAAGLFFGEYCAPLSVLEQAFIGLLQMTVLPYIFISLIANIGRLSLRQSNRLAVVGGITLLLLWAVALLSVVLLSGSFPSWQAGSTFSIAQEQTREATDLVELFIPSNIFASLSDGQVPAVVLMCIVSGLALSGVNERDKVIDSLDVLAKVLIRVNTQIVRLTPLGVFAIAANTTGTMSLGEVERLQAYLIVYTLGAAALIFLAFPLLITTCTPFTYREVMRVSRDSLITAFVTGKLIIVLPLLIEHTEQLFARQHRAQGDSTAPAVDTLYPIAYSFPHAGKLLSILFIPFAAWFLGNGIPWSHYPTLLSSGLLSYFGGPILAIPTLLDQMHLPHDMFQLFLLSGVWCGRLGDAVGVMHLVAFTVLTTCAFTGRLQLRWGALARYGAVLSVTSVALIVTLRLSLAPSLKSLENRSDVFAEMQLLDQPAPATVAREAAPNPDPLLPGESLLERIRRRGVIRVAYNADALPFAYFNAHGDLVGFDVNLAHALALDLNASIEFVPFSHANLLQQSRDDHFDVVMSGLVGTLERAEMLEHTSPYLELTLSVVVRDHRSDEFRSIRSMASIDGLRLAYVDLSGRTLARLRKSFPLAQLIELQTNQQFFDDTEDRFDGLLIGAESGSAYTLLYPHFEVVLPDNIRSSLPLFYVTAARDDEMRRFLQYWITVRKDDGTFQEYYDHWILGKTMQHQPPRWSVLRNVLGWGG